MEREWLSVWRPSQSGENTVSLGVEQTWAEVLPGLLLAVALGSFLRWLPFPGSLRPLDSEGHTCHLQVGVRAGQHAARIWTQSCLTLVEGLWADGQAPREVPAAHPLPIPPKTAGSEARKSCWPGHGAGDLMASSVSERLIRCLKHW